MAYLHLMVKGNPDFGGYISLNGARSVPVQDDWTWEIADGMHSIKIYSKSNVSRTAGKITGAATAISYNYSALSRASLMMAANDIGDEWEIGVNLAPEDCLFIQTYSRGNQIVAAPTYYVETLSDEMVVYLENRFREQYEEQARIEEERRQEKERIASMPRRRKGQIVWGVILMAIGTVMSFAGISYVADGYVEEVAFIPVGLLIIGLGVLKFCLGMRKKVRGRRR